MQKYNLYYSYMLLHCSHSVLSYINDLNNYLLLLPGPTLLLRLLVEDIQPTNTGMLDSDVDFIILLGLGVM